MSKVIIFSQKFPAYHPRKGELTNFVEKFWSSVHADFNFKTPLKALGLVNLDATFDPKSHTIRAGKRWKVGDAFSPRIWSGKPYRSKQITIALDTIIKKVWDFEIRDNEFFVDGKQLGSLQNVDLAINDGLHSRDFLSWFQFPKPFVGQIICWDKNVYY